jgi:Subtilisin inhibitor-like
MHLAVAAATSLSIAVSPTGSAPWRHATLTCAPAGGTLAHAAAACAKLDAMRAPFAPVRKGVACTQIYGGPDVARVTGTFRGRKIWAVFRRRNGCEIARWNAVAFLIGKGTGPAR